MPTAQQSNEFCYDHIVTDDGAVAFKCSGDADAYPWLKLDPANNVAIQATNYFSLSSVSAILERRDPDKWTALTSFAWRVFGGGATHPTHGSADARQGEGLDFGASFFGPTGDLVYRMTGTGVIFKTRDFDAWRAKAKAEAAKLPAPTGFVFASPEDAGVATAAECFVSPLREEGGAQFCEALITKEGGFPPVHPYHDGSGDHVNSSHLLDVAQQAAHLVRQTAGFPVAGEVQFTRYVELDRAIRVRISGEKVSPTLKLAVFQGEHQCAGISFHY